MMVAFLDSMAAFTSVMLMSGNSPACAVTARTVVASRARSFFMVFFCVWFEVSVLSGRVRPEKDYPIPSYHDPHAQAQWSVLEHPRRGFVRGKFFSFRHGTSGLVTEPGTLQTPGHEDSPLQFPRLRAGCGELCG